MVEQKIKVKKKTWVKILSPAIFGQKEIGETIVFEPKKLVGKKIDTNLMILTGDPRKQHVTIGLIVT